MSINKEEFLEYYAGLLIIQYKNKLKAKNTIRLLVHQSLCDDLLKDLLSAFDLDTALGAQLDILGRIVGVPRQIYGLDLNNTFFNLDNYDEDGSVGFGLYADAPYDTELWLRYRSDAVYTLEDYEMRNLIKIKIIQNNTHPSLNDIVDTFNDLFGSDVTLIDNYDMSIQYRVSSFYESIFLIAQYLGVLPKPMGVAVDVSVSSSSSSSSSST